MKKKQFIKPSIRYIKLDEQENLLQTSEIITPIDPSPTPSSGGINNGSSNLDF